ncbi:MAG: RNA pseudouridine synthase [Rhodobacteraceae bacterium]|nr:RNA pseudouridine synthase [Paracoccaceae bacterium]
MQAEFTYAPPTGPLAVLHRDADLLLLNKPSGLLSVPGKAAKHADCLETRAKASFPEALLVHRLDMDTSGVMIFAMNKAAQRHLGLQFERRHLAKTYEALVWGQPDDHGEVDLPLIVDWPNRPLQMVDHTRGKKAHTKWEVLVREASHARVRLMPTTGRSHQLRVHMLAIGHVILGDRFYAKDEALTAAPRLCLHALSLEIYHPNGGERVAFQAPCPF